MTEKYLQVAEMYERFTRWMRDGAALGDQFRHAGISLPPPLKSALEDGDGTDGGDNDTHLEIPPVNAPPRPREAGSNWIWIPASKAEPQTLMLAMLRKQEDFVAAKEIAQAVEKITVPKINMRSVYNAGSRLIASGVISKAESEEWRGSSGWKLVDRSSAPILDGDYIWGSPEMFSPQDIAEHRRAVVVHLLSIFPDGLQVMQIVRQLQASSIYKGSVSKDLLKTDMEALLAEHRVRKMGNTRKWTVVSSE